MSEGLRVCRKCLLEQTSLEEYAASLKTYIENLNEEDRVDQKLYEERLGKCARCENLLSGMCRLCGCFVGLRAALKVRKCPDLPRRW